MSPKNRCSIPLLFSMLLLALAGCKKAAGSSCSKGDSKCQDKTTQLVCEDGKLIPTPCQGPSGCLESELGVSCDIKGNAPGSRCGRDDEGAAACVEEHKMIACRGGEYRSVPCRGPKGCETESDRAMCDTSIGAANDPCKDEGSKACTTDGKDALACTLGEMQFVYHCRGPEGCASKDGQLECDMSVAALKDPCDKKMEGATACNTDGSGTVICKGGSFVLDEKCKSGTRCSSKAGSIECVREAKGDE
jgi:hypothetical protein